MSQRSRFHPLEHRLMDVLQALNLKSKRLVLATSGGVDSMACLHLLARLSSYLELDLFVAHVHHGALEGEQGRFRDRAFLRVQKYCKNQELSFYSNAECSSVSEEWVWKTPAPPAMRTEAEFRDFRYAWLEAIVTEVRADYMITAHTSEDLLESRLIQLIRGSGVQGFLSLSPLNQRRLRPLLGFSRRELTDYLRSESVSWVEDPSNVCEEPLRNWLRQKWLPQLEAKQEGAVFRLSQSIDNLAAALRDSMEKEAWPLTWGPEGLELRRFLQLSRFQQKQTLAQYMNALGMKSYRTTHIEEILKRLDKDSQRTQFYLLGHDWTLGPKYISASPRGG